MQELVTVVPWGVVWVGIVIAISGAVLSLHSIGQRQSNRVADAGAVAVLLGLILMLAPPLVNGTVMLAQAFGSAARSAIASTQPSDTESASR